ncbi:hypothetical protein [Vibrio sp. WXL103]|uniref:hypothetical protein n=1 Tax=Vibrio sp. WXL103 TaxID=3450710 RepID=UPI003EC73E5A
MYTGNFDTYYDPFAEMSIKFPSNGEYYSANTGARYKGHFYAVPTRGLESSNYKFVDDYEQKHRYVHIVFIGTLYFNQLKEDVVLARENYIIGHPFIESTYASLVPAYPAKLEEMKSKYELELKEHEQTQIRHEEQAQRSSAKLSDLFAAFISTAAATYGVQDSDTSKSLPLFETDNNASANTASSSTSTSTTSVSPAHNDSVTTSSTMRNTTSRNGGITLTQGKTQSVVNVNYYDGPYERLMIVPNCAVAASGFDFTLVKTGYYNECLSQYPGQRDACRNQASRKASRDFNDQFKGYQDYECPVQDQGPTKPPGSTIGL